jgi:acetyltransferase-like isoleucine patch superfamily enzyme/lysophospholipase L1-like esterase
MTRDAHAVADRLRAAHGTALQIGQGCDLAADLLIDLAEDARIVIGDRVSIGRGTTLRAGRGAVVVLGDGAAIGEHCFVSALVGIRVGDGSVLGNLVELCDHRRRGGRVEAAPVVIESRVTVSAKATVAAGVRIGRDALIGPNTLVAHSVAPAGVGPDGVAPGGAGPDAREPEPERRTLRVGWFGTSIMEHFEGYNARLVMQSDLPEVGATLTVEDWHGRGYVQRAHLGLQAAWPHLTFDFDNRAKAGATSRDIARIAEETVTGEGNRYDLVFLCCGINDVWRTFQDRPDEAVGPDEYAGHYAAILRLLTAASRTVVCMTETPFGPLDAPNTVVAMNTHLSGYNVIAARAAHAAGAALIDLWTPFTAAARHLPTPLPGDQLPGLWSDGAHLSELGDTLVLRRIESFLAEHRTIEELADYPLLDPAEAARRYADLFAAFRAGR